MHALGALILLLALLAGCGGEPDASGENASAGSAAIPTDDLPPALAGVYEQGGALLGGGAEAFRAQLAELEGHPVVVNKWASWCEPCRAEFPFLRSQAERRAGRIAFLGVNSSDDPAAAEAFLDESPIPYPSYRDPDLEVADAVGAVGAFPATAFYDERGELVYLKQGGYATEEALAADIQRYLGER